VRHGAVHRPPQAAGAEDPALNSARKIKLRATAPKPRNPLVVPAAQRKAGSHRKSRAADRQADKAQLRKQLKDL
jgi:hypothetical protein